METKYNINQIVWVIINPYINGDYITQKDNYYRLEYWLGAKADYIKIKKIIIEDGKNIYIADDYRLNYISPEDIKPEDENLLYFEEDDLYYSKEQAEWKINKMNNWIRALRNMIWDKGYNCKNKCKCSCCNCNEKEKDFITKIIELVKNNK